MPLFIFRRVENPAREYWEGRNERWPELYATHPSRESVSEEEVGEMLERARKRYMVESARSGELADQIIDQLVREGVPASDPKFSDRLYQRLGELGAFCGMRKSLSEILEEDGFRILSPQVFSYQTPLSDYEQKINAGVAEIEKRVAA